MTPKQRLQLEIIDIDRDLQKLSNASPQSRPVIDRIRDALGRCVHLVHGVDTLDFCAPVTKNNDHYDDDVDFVVGEGGVLS